MDVPLMCPQCHAAVADVDDFCPHCGKRLKEPTAPLSWGRISVVYLLSFFLPPIGFYYGHRYLKNPHVAAKKVATVAIILTSISLLITLVTIVLGIKLARDIIQSTQEDFPADFQTIFY